jgi:hypothetical protein
LISGPICKFFKVAIFTKIEGGKPERCYVERERRGVYEIELEGYEKESGGGEEEYPPIFITEFLTNWTRGGRYSQRTYVSSMVSKEGEALSRNT